MQAWVIDDTGVVKDGKHSPGIKRQYSGTLGKRCIYRRSGVKIRSGRREAKIPEGVEFQTKPQQAAGSIERAAAWDILTAPVLGVPCGKARAEGDLKLLAQLGLGLHDGRRLQGVGDEASGSAGLVHGSS